MPITLNCPKCHKPFRVRDESVGMRVKCPTCGAVLQVPTHLSSSSMEAPREAAGAGPAATAPTMKRSGAGPAHPGGESLLEGLPGPSPVSGPPSLPVSPTQTRRREDDDLDDRRRAATSGPLPPLPSTRRPGTAKLKPAAAKNAAAEESAEQIIEDAEGWAKFRSGVRLVQIGLFFCLLFPLYQFGLAAYGYKYFMKIPAEIPDQPAGLLGVNGVSLFQELDVATLLGGGLLAFLFSAIGLLKCGNVPTNVRTRGLVGGTLLLACVTFVGFALIFVDQLRPFVELPAIPRIATELASRYFIYVAVLTVAWFTLLLGQAAERLPTTKVLTETAYSALLVVLFLIGTQVADQFYPLSRGSPKFAKENLVEVYTVEAAVHAVLAALIVLRLMSIAGIVRSSIRLWREDNAAVLEGAAG